MDWSVVVITLIGVASVTLCVKVKIDVEAFLDRRNDARKAKLQRTCPHIIMSFAEDGKPKMIEDKIEMIPGSMTSVCNICGGVMIKNPENHMANAKYWATRPYEYKKAIKQVNKLRNKIR